MIVDIVFYGSIAYLVALVVWKLLLSKGSKGAGSRPGRISTVARQIFNRGWVVAGVVLALAATSCVLKFEPNLLSRRDNLEQADLSHFVEAITQYDYATDFSTNKPNLTNDDWETVSAMLQAALAEGEQVRPELLEKLHPELPQKFQEQFLPGLRIGTYGLRSFTNRSKSTADSVAELSDDSLKVGRQLLGEWTQWFKSHRTEIMEQVE